MTILVDNTPKVTRYRVYSRQPPKLTCMFFEPRNCSQLKNRQTRVGDSLNIVSFEKEWRSEDQCFLLVMRSVMRSVVLPSLLFSIHRIHFPITKFKNLFCLKSFIVNLKSCIKCSFTLSLFLKMQKPAQKVREFVDSTPVRVHQTLSTSVISHSQQNATRTLAWTSSLKCFWPWGSGDVFYSSVGSIIKLICTKVHTSISAQTVSKQLSLHIS